MKKTIIQNILSKLVKAKNNDASLRAIITPLKTIVLISFIVVEHIIYVSSPERINIERQILFWGLLLWIITDFSNFVNFTNPFRLSQFLKSLVYLSDTDFLAAMDLTEKNYPVLRKLINNTDTEFANELIALLTEKFSLSVKSSDDQEHTKGYCRATYPKTCELLGWNKKISG